jgi:hypothetical protein
MYLMYGSYGSDKVILIRVLIHLVFKKKKLKTISIDKAREQESHCLWLVVIGGIKIWKICAMAQQT